MADTTLTRFDALQAIAAEYPTEPIVVALGTMVREMLLAGRADNHLYVLDSMGLPPAIGLGLALAPAARRFDKVVVVEGDGAFAHLLVHVSGFDHLVSTFRTREAALCSLTGARR
jgi:thiamine pyrophosphate-dependent acetolactate synthase large subunit-like protein